MKIGRAGVVAEAKRRTVAQPTHVKELKTDPCVSHSYQVSIYSAEPSRGGCGRRRWRSGGRNLQNACARHGRISLYKNERENQKGSGTGKSIVEFIMINAS